jgi:hypothetical protein
VCGAGNAARRLERDRSRLGSKHHVICCGNGIPLALTVTAANRNDVTQLLQLVDRIAPVGPHAAGA